jgi:hypothetical protein
MVVAAGCATTQRSDALVDDEALTTIEIERYQYRVGQLSQLWADGVVELRWHDESGKHVTQGDLEAWVVEDDHTALRVSKLGEVLLWLGSDQTTRWAFDLTKEPTTLQTHSSEESKRSWVDPRDLRCLLGIEPIPIGNGEVILIEGETVTTSDRRRLTIDPATGVATVIELLDEDGAVWARATHQVRSIRQVDRPGVPLSQRPHMAFAIDIKVIGGDDLVKMSFEEISTDLTSQPLQMLFDLDRLTQALQPQRHLTPASTPGAAP